MSVIALVALATSFAGSETFGSVCPKQTRCNVSVIRQGKASYPIPPFARIKSVDYDAKRAKLNIAFQGAIPKKNLGYMSVEVYFEGNKKPYSHLAIPLGTANYQRSGEAWVFDSLNWKPIRKITSAVRNDGIELSGFGNASHGKKIDSVYVRYLPPTYNVKNLSHGATMIETDIWQWQDGTPRSIVLPSGPPVR